MRKSCLRAVWVILAVFVLPLGIWAYSAAAPEFSGAAVAGAELTFGTSLRESSSGITSPEPRMMLRSPASSGIGAGESSERDESISGQPQDERKPVGIETEKPPAALLLSEPYPEKQDNRSGPLEKTHYGPYSGPLFFDLDGGGQVRNGTHYSNAELLAQSRLPPAFSTDHTEGAPLVLIYHTHATESYEPADRDFYDSSFKSKTTDPTRSVVEVGARICRELEAAGIPYIHDTLIHDRPTYSGAYDSSRSTVKALLEKYPSIKIVLDIHRDGLQQADGTRIAPVADIGGRDAAQIMMISGCDDGTMGMPDHLKNFRFACALQQELESSFPGLTRPIFFDYRHYNQDLSTGALLIEVGSHGNSLEQAFYAGELIGKGLAGVVERYKAGK